MTDSPNVVSETIMNQPAAAPASPPKVPADGATTPAKQPEAEADSPAPAKQEPTSKSETLKN